MNVDSNADPDAEKPNDVFLEFCQFCMERKEFGLEMKTLYDFPYFLMHARPFYLISSCSETNLGIYMPKVDNKSTRARYETCLVKRYFVVFIVKFKC